MATNTVTTEQVHEAIEQLAAMVAAASISPQTVADILEMLRNLNDQEREKVIAIAESYIQQIQDIGITADHVTLDSGEPVQSVIEKLIDASFYVESYDYSDFTVGQYYTLTGTTPSSPTAASNFSSFVTLVKAGQKINLKTVGASNARAYALTDKNRTILSVAPANADYSSGTEIQVEEDGYLYVNDNNGLFTDTSVVIAEDKIENLNKNVEDLQWDIYQTKELLEGTFVQNGTIKGDGSFVEVSTYSIYSYAVSEGYVLRIQTRIASSSSLADRVQVAAYNGNTYVGAVAEGNLITDVKYTVPSGVNKICVYNGNTYSQSVERTINNGLEGDVADMKEDVSQLQADTTEMTGIINNSLYYSRIYAPSDFTDGAFYNLSGTTAPSATEATEATGWICLCVPVKAGQTITLKAYGGNTGRTWALTDSNRNILSIAAESADCSTGIELQAQRDGYLYINDNIYRLAKNSVSASVVGNNMEILQETMGALQEEVEELQGSLDESGAAKIYNPRANLSKSGLKILDIGNSYTVDATHYLPNIIANANIEDTYSLYSIVRSSGSFKTWVDCYNDEDTVQYSFALVAGTRLMNLPQGNYPAGDGSYFRTVLNDKWDVIIIHQVSTYSADYRVWEGNTNGGYLKEFIRILKLTNPHAQIGFLLTHSYPSGSNFNPEHSSDSRWQKIAKSTKWIMANYGIDFVIPYGTAVQNLRQCTDIVDSNELSTDGTHMADGLGDYVSACCYFQQLFGAMKGTSVLGDTFRLTVDETVDGQVSVNDDTALLAQKAAILACANMFSITNPETT